MEIFEIDDNTKVKLVICKDCRTVKATIANVFGDTGWCSVCGKSNKFQILRRDNLVL